MRELDKIYGIQLKDGEIKCQNCEHYHATGHDNNIKRYGVPIEKGQCRINPPVAFFDREDVFLNNYAQFPVVKHFWSCGEFVPDFDIIQFRRNVKREEKAQIERVGKESASGAI